jgi:hypothetical protein
MIIPIFTSNALSEDLFRASPDMRRLWISFLPDCYIYSLLFKNFGKSGTDLQSLSPASNKICARIALPLSPAKFPD